MSASIPEKRKARMSRILRDFGVRVAGLGASWETTERIIDTALANRTLPCGFQLLAELRYAAQEPRFAHLLVPMLDGHKMPIIDAAQICSPLDASLLRRLTIHVVRYYAILENVQQDSFQAAHRRQRWPLRDWLTAGAIRLAQLVSQLKR